MTPPEITQLWRRLADIWGARFTQQFGDSPNPTWTEALTPLPLDHAREALRTLIASGTPHPPTLPELVAAVRSSQRKRALEERSREALLPPPPTDPERARANLRLLRAALGPGPATEGLAAGLAGKVPGESR